MLAIKARSVFSSVRLFVLAKCNKRLAQANLTSDTD